jgi:uncharacterized protein
LSVPDNPQLEQIPPGIAEPGVLAPEVAPDASGTGPAAVPVPTPPRDPLWSGWDVTAIAALTLVALFVTELLTAVGARLFFYPKSSFRDLLQSPVLALLGEFFGYIAVALFMIMLVEGKYRVNFWKAIRWNWPSTGGKALAWGLVGIFTVSLDLLGRYLPMPKSSPFDEFFTYPGAAYLIAAFAVTLGPLMEELFFRGFLYPVLARRTGIPVAVVLTAIPFGLMHYLQYRSWAAVLVVTLVGVVLTVVRAATQSVAASFLVHVGYNATLMSLAAIATDGFRHMEKAATALLR